MKQSTIWSLPTFRPRPSWLLSMLSIFFAVHLSHAQPTFDECKIFLVASDTARDLSLNREPEYIRFINLVARTFLIQDDFATYDTLPLMLQTTYKAYAWTADHEIDISAASFGAPVSDEQTKILRSFCDETSRLVATLMETSAPTWSPTVYVEETEPPTTPVSFDVETAQGNLLPGPSDALSELPIECRRGLFGSDFDKDGFLDHDEYAMFVSTLKTDVYSHSSEFDKLPQELKDNYDMLKEDNGKMNIFGALPAQWAEATTQQRSFLQLFCYRTEDALEAAARQKPNETAVPTAVTTPPPYNQTVAPTPHVNNTIPPNATNASNPSTTPPTTSPTASTTKESVNNHEKDKLSGGAIVAIVGSIVIVLMGLYLARDKQSIFQKYFDRCRNRRSSLKISPFRTGDVKDHDMSASEQCPPTSQSPYDLDSSGEQTGFLEDHRMGTHLSVTREGDEMEEDEDEESQAPSRTSSGYGFQTIRSNSDEFSAPPPQYASSGNTIRFNPDDFIEPEEVQIEEDESEEVQLEEDESEHYVAPDLTPDEENMINADFQDYMYDNSQHSMDDDSSAMSLYCTSVADEKPGPQQGSVVSNVPPATKKAHRRLSTAEMELLSEFPSPRRNPSTMYHANRFGQIAQSESKPDAGGSSPSKKPIRGGKKKPKPKKPPTKAPAKLTAKQNGQRAKPKKIPGKPPAKPHGQGEPKTPKATNKKLKKRPSNRRPLPPNVVKEQNSKPTHTNRTPQAMPEPEPQPPSGFDRFLRNAMEQWTDSSDSESTAFHFTEEPENAPTNASPVSPDQWSLSHGGKAYSIDAGDASPRPNPTLSQASPARRMQPTEITTGKHDDSVSASTSFLSDDFTDPGDEAGLSKNNVAPPATFQRPNFLRTAGNGKQRAMQADNHGRESGLEQGAQHMRREPRRTPDLGDQKTANETDHRDGLSLDESIESCTSFSNDSNSANKDVLGGDNDSTYEGTESHTSFTFPPESTSSSISILTPEGDPIQEIHRLVAIVMPSEHHKVTQMLDQYKGREVELLKTLKRLEVRMKARQFSGRPVHVPPVSTNKNDRAARMRTIRHQAHERRRSSVVAENAAMLAAAASASGSDAKRIFSAPSVAESEHTRMIDLDLSSGEEEDEDDFSQDSTYYDDQGSAITSIHDDGSLSIFSGLR